MKQPVAFFRWKPFLVMLFLSLFSLVLWGQEEGSGGGESSTSTTTTTRSTSVSVTDGASGAWYTSPWVWVVGAAVFILLLVALLSNRGKDTVRVSKTVERDRS
jgi:ABC-type Fe3+ transport system permease subunit